MLGARVRPPPSTAAQPMRVRSSLDVAALQLHCIGRKWRLVLYL